VTILYSAFKMHTGEMRTVGLRCPDGWMRFAVATRNFEMKVAPGDSLLTKRMLLCAQFCDMTQMPHCEPLRTGCQSPQRWFALICRGLAIPWNLYGGLATRWQVSWSKFGAICVYKGSRKSMHTRTIFDSILSRGMRADLITNMFRTGYGPHGMRTRLKWRPEPLPPRKLCWRFYGILTAFMCVTMWPPGELFNAS
jgi:hypothetical protein